MSTHSLSELTVNTIEVHFGESMSILLLVTGVWVVLLIGMSITQKQH